MNGRMTCFNQLELLAQNSNYTSNLIACTVLRSWNIHSFFMMLCLINWTHAFRSTVTLTHEIKLNTLRYDLDLLPWSLV